MRIKSALSFTALFILCVAAHAQAPAPKAEPAAAKVTADVNAGGKPERGWFFFEGPPKAPEPQVKEEPAPLPPTAKPPPPKEERCKQKGEWSADCGFVDPGEDFEFQAKQRDALMERMAVARNDPKAVEAFQYYMRWVMDRSTEVANLWWYNASQNPELDPSVRSPISSFGLRLMADVRSANNSSFFKMLKEEGAFFVYFSRSDCSFCHQMAEPLRMLALNTGLPIRNASLDEKCMPAFVEQCVTAAVATAPAQALKVETVPAIFLYTPPNTWIRIATGVTDAESMANRTFQFFTAYRNALLAGINNSVNGRPSVDFSGAKPSGVSEGVAGSTAPVKQPTQEDVSKLLGVK